MVGVNLSRLLGRAGVSRTLPRPPARPPRASRVGLPAAAVEGVGTVSSLDPGQERGVVVLAFLTSTCEGCRRFWDGLATAELPGAPRVVAVTPGPELEDRRKVAALAPDGLAYVMSARAWTDYDVTKSPFAVVVRSGRIAGEGPLAGWDDLRRLLVQPPAL